MLDVCHGSMDPSIYVVRHHSYLWVFALLRFPDLKPEHHLFLPIWSELFNIAIYFHVEAFYQNHTSEFKGIYLGSGSSYRSDLSFTPILYHIL